MRLETFKNELKWLIQLGVLHRNTDSVWGSPSLIIPKKNGQVRFLTDFSQLNDKLVRKPFPIPRILYLVQTLQAFTYATVLDLNMGYYTIRLDPKAQEMCTIVTPWGKYSYERLPMGVMCAPDIFQDRMSSLMYELE